MSETKKLTIPELALVVLVGASGSGKSTFAKKHFRATEILSSDAFRGMVSDDENDQSATTDAFAALHYLARTRLRRGKLVVVDATNVQKEARAPLLALAREGHCVPVAIVLDLPETVCVERNATRPDRAFGARVVRNHARELRRSLRHLKDEGFRHVHVLSSVDEVEAATIERVPLWNDKKTEHGPFDVIGDVHGCHDELVALLERMGWQRSGTDTAPAMKHPAGRKAIFLGDLVDRGPKVVPVLELVMNMVESGDAYCIPGNHEEKLRRKLAGREVKVAHGLAETLAQLEPAGEAFRDRVRAFIDDRISHYVLDDGKLVVAHAGLKEELQGRASGKVRAFCLFGETTGEIDEYGLPVRADWARDYRGKACVVYGHTPVPSAEWVNGTICIDTGCVFGGELTALRWPEKELVSVPAQRMYWEPARPIAKPSANVAPRETGVLDRDDVAGKRFLETRHHPPITLREENTSAALEVMSRWAVDPRWLVYLPPTMSPAEAAKDEGFLEHPREVFAYYRAQGVTEVVCEEKHMGSRAVLVVCRDPAVALTRFGLDAAARGVITTRTGRPFFADASGLERAVLDRIAAAAEKAGLWDELATDWMVLDAEILPWSGKAQELLRHQYAPVATAGEATVGAAVSALARTASPGAAALGEKLAGRLAAVRAFRDAYRRYSWDVTSIEDWKVAPFHLLASEGTVHVERDHPWHMTTLARLADVEPLVRKTPWQLVTVDDPASVESGVRFWTELTAAGGEGMVTKPRAFLARAPGGGTLVQPALKCRGREYLRLIYGPDYLAPESFERLRVRNVGTKRSLALRELALGLEALHRFVEREPLHRVHECVFGVLALESVPVDPRL